MQGDIQRHAFGIPAGQKAGPRGGTDRITRMEIGKPNPLFGHPIDGRCFDGLAPVTSQVSVSQIIGINDDNVGGNSGIVGFFLDVIPAISINEGLELTSISRLGTFWKLVGKKRLAEIEPITELQQSFRHLIASAGIHPVVAPASHGRRKTNRVGIQQPDIGPFFLNRHIKGIAALV